ncbi:hypothetical protein LCGC14_1078620 [marine sediment metagenome]|uniref:KOW domain-containing protein n=1 Tax=marine sediment metagenome TaxID=412755 RepID=A0A0F9N3L0_9ZZZZ
MGSRPSRPKRKIKMYKIGDKVVILRKDIKDLPTTLATITGTRGYYIIVRPDNSRREIELYPEEIRSREKPNRGKF